MGNGRLPSADHLAGFAAECCLKAILIRFLGAALDQWGKPYSTVGNQTVKHGHLPSLWANLSLVATGRAGAQFGTLISGPNPFAAWDVGDRYLDGSAISQARVQQHVTEAKKIMAIHQLAEIAGSLP